MGTPAAAAAARPFAALAALNRVLLSIESVRNGQALYLLMMGFAAAGLCVAMGQQALGGAATTPAVLWLAAAGLAVFYGSNATGLVLMDEACGRPPRPVPQALRDALRQAHRLLLVVAVVLLLALALLLACWGLLWACRLPAIGPTLMTPLVTLAVPALGLTLLAMVGLVGPLAAPAVWAGLAPRAVLALLLRQARQRFAHAVLLAAAVSLLSAAVAGLVSFVVLAGARALLLLSATVPGLDLAPQPLLAALFGTGLRVAAGAPPPSAHTAAAVTGAGIVFALGLVLPTLVYLRGLCELYLALAAADAPEPPPPATLPVTPPVTPPAASAETAAGR